MADDESSCVHVTDSMAQSSFYLCSPVDLYRIQSEDSLHLLLLKSFHIRRVHNSGDTLVCKSRQWGLVGAFIFLGASTRRNSKENVVFAPPVTLLVMWTVPWFCWSILASPHISRGSQISYWKRSCCFCVNITPLLHSWIVVFSHQHGILVTFLNYIDECHMNVCAHTSTLIQTCR